MRIDNPRLVGNMFKDISPDSVRSSRTCLAGPVRQDLSVSGRTCPANLGVQSCLVKKLICPVRLSQSRCWWDASKMNDSFMLNWFQSVIWNGIKSKSYPLTHWVAKGSILGPLLLVYSSGKKIIRILFRFYCFWVQYHHSCDFQYMHSSST